MPLSRKRNKERMGEVRHVQPKASIVQPNIDALQSKSSGIEPSLSSKLPVQPKRPLFPPSKFLSPEQDMIVQENVVNTLKGMSGVRLQQFMGLSNTFTPNKDRK